MHLDHYYLEKEGVLYPLTNEVNTVEIDHKTFEKESKSYIVTMKYLMQDAYEIMDDIESTSFDHASIIKTTKKYHDLVCDDEKCVIYYKVQNKMNDIPWKITFGP